MRVELGQPADFEALCREHPNVAGELRQLESDWNRHQSFAQRAGIGRETQVSLADELRARFGADVDPAVALDGSEPPTGRDASSELLDRLRARASDRVRYRLLGEIGRGGMGVVLKIWDEDLRRSLAMKVVLGEESSAMRRGKQPLDSRALSRFLEEAQITGQLDHPGIVPVHELGLGSDGRVYFTMRLVKGEDLRTIYDHVETGHDGWNQTRALGVLLKVCEALSYAHDKGVVHRDLKPANIMVGKFGEVYVMDWGLARVLGQMDRHDLRLRPEESGDARVITERSEIRPDSPQSPLITMDGAVVGTPAYMPPEQASGKVEQLGPRSDVYAVGAMLYHLLAGEMPFVPRNTRMSTHAVLARVLAGPPRPLIELAPRTPAELVAICEKAMEREPARRYADVLTLAVDLRAFLERRVVRAYETGAWAETKKWVERNKPLAASLLGVIVLLAAGLTTSLVFKSRADENAVLASRRADETAEQARIAKANEERALTSEALATEQGRVATRRANDVLSLSASKDLEDLIDRADALWPAHPENIDEYEEWLRDARALIEGQAADDSRGVKAKPGLVAHKQKLAELEARALPQTDEEKAAERSAHPRAPELARKRAKSEWMARMLGKLPWPSESEAEAAVDRLSPTPADARAWNELAWPLVDPDPTKEVFGDEVMALVCARRAVDESLDTKRYEARDTLAWALFKLGRFDEALEQEQVALEEAPESARTTYAGLVEKLKRAIETWESPSSEGRVAREKEWSDLDSEVRALEAVLSVRSNWNFADSEDRWWHMQLTKLIASLESLADPKSGLFSTGTSEDHGWGIGRRAEFARKIEESSVRGREARARWDEALASIRDEAQCPKYSGLVITPQLGLLPIGRDKDSGLWEFAHLLTGETAQRGADENLILKEETGLVFVLVPGGSQWMGAQATDPMGQNYDSHANSNESPIHEIQLKPFFVSKYELTQGQWKRFTGRNPSNFGPDARFGDKQHDLRHPVEQVSFENCTQVLGRMGLALPTEAQWEHAARAGTPTPWWTGEDFHSLDGAANLADASCKRNGGPLNWAYEEWLDDGHPTHAPIGTYRSNGYGLHDVVGNVWEWCRDGYGGYNLPVTAGDAERQVADLRDRVFRGGGFTGTAVYARSAIRLHNTPEHRTANLGLRPISALRLSDVIPSPR